MLAFLLRRGEIRVVDFDPGRGHWPAAELEGPSRANQVGRRGTPGLADKVGAHRHHLATGRPFTAGLFIGRAQA